MEPVMAVRQGDRTQPRILLWEGVPGQQGTTSRGRASVLPSPGVLQVLQTVFLRLWQFRWRHQQSNGTPPARRSLDRHHPQLHRSYHTEEGQTTRSLGHTCLPPAASSCVTGPLLLGWTAEERTHGPQTSQARGETPKGSEAFPDNPRSGFAGSSRAAHRIAERSVPSARSSAQTFAPPERQLAQVAASAQIRAGYFLGRP